MVLPRAPCIKRMGKRLLNIKMVRLLSIASLLLLSHVSLVAANAIPLVPGGSIAAKKKCDIKGGQCESYDI